MQSMESRKNRVYPYLFSIVLVSATTLFGELIKKKLEPTNLGMLYLLIVVIAAVRWGEGPAIVTSVLGAVCFDFFLIPPYLTLTVAHIQYVFTLIGFLVVGLVVSTLASKMREQAIQARTQEAQTAALYRLSIDLANSESFSASLQAIRKNISHVLNCQSAIFLPSAKAIESISYDPGFIPTDEEKKIALWVFNNVLSAGMWTDNFTDNKNHYVPLKTSQGVLGVLGIKFKENKNVITAGEANLLEAFVSQSAVAIQRARLAEESRQIELMRQTEKLQSALLSSISHDLKTPLATITGALTTLIDAPDVDESAGKELLETARDESDRLNLLVNNLLDMTRMEAGALRISREPCELRDVLGASLEQLKEKIGHRNVKIVIPKDFPDVPMDFSFMMKVFINLIDNALKYSSPDSLISITADSVNNKAQIEIKDQGIGIHEGDLKKIFNKFYRAEKPRHIKGTGLGLSICKAIVEAHGGEIYARNNSDKGATFVIVLPFA